MVVPRTELSDVYQRYARSTFYIETPQGKGTGWLVGPGEIVTAQHVVGSNTSVTVRSAYADAFPATVFAKDSVKDIALITFNANLVSLPGTVAVTLASTINDTPNGSPVLALGHTQSGVKDTGRVGAPNAKAGIKSQGIQFGDDSYGRNLIVDAPLDPGDSGGPIFNASGALVGMSRAGVLTTSSGQRVVGVFYGVAVDEILSRLPALRSGISR
ncbi:MAG: trypsin-like peptidase domain-containing protein [SAR202 cluster bacterium]|nr:trypsin-like peptidase domain-containing protein [SAR202 cluster bacterium]